MDDIMEICTNVCNIFWNVPEISGTEYQTYQYIIHAMSLDVIIQYFSSHQFIMFHRIIRLLVDLAAIILAAIIFATPVVPTPVVPVAPAPYAPGPAPPRAPPPPSAASQPPKRADFPVLRADAAPRPAKKPPPKRQPAAGGWSSALAKAGGKPMGTKSKTGLSIAAPRRARPAPAPAAAAAADFDFSAPPEHCGAAPKPPPSGPPGFPKKK